MYNLQDVFEQAKAEDYAVTLKGAGYKYILLHGIQIVKDDETNEVQIVNTHRGVSTTLFLVIVNAPTLLAVGGVTECTH